MRHRLVRDTVAMGVDDKIGQCVVDLSPAEA